jgi:hypothetical protein
MPLYLERKKFYFIGNFLHEPNWNAVFKEAIWPLIRAGYPDGVLHIYGAYPSKVLQLNVKRFPYNGSC